MADITKYVKLFQKFAEIQVILMGNTRNREKIGFYSFFKEEENQNIKDVLTELKGGIDPTAN